MNIRKLLPPIVLVSENDQVSVYRANVDNKDQERHDRVYTKFLLDFFSSICEKVELIDKLENLPSFLENNQEFIVFSIWSGSNSRNRMALVPAICESFGASYIGADSYAKTICQDKFISRNIAKRVGFKIPRAILIEREEHIQEINWLNFPIVLKPNMEGSSIGIRKIENDEDFKKNARPMLKKYDNSLIAEEFIQGREIAIMIYGDVDNPKVLGAVEIIHENIDSYYIDRIFNSEDKKKKNYKRIDVSEEIDASIYSLAKRAFCSLGKMDFLRIDGRLNSDGEFHFIEFSPIPNFSDNSSIATISSKGESKAITVAKEIISINSYKNQ